MYQFDFPCGDSPSGCANYVPVNYQKITTVVKEPLEIYVAHGSNIWWTKIILKKVGS
jgi:hypothetical protein